MSETSDPQATIGATSNRAPLEGAFGAHSSTRTETSAVRLRMRSIELGRDEEGVDAR